MRWNRDGSAKTWDPVVQTLTNVADKTKLRDTYHGCTRLLKSDSFAFDSSGNNGIVNEVGGTLDLV